MKHVVCDPKWTKTVNYTGNTVISFYFAILKFQQFNQISNIDYNLNFRFYIDDLNNVEIHGRVFQFYIFMVLKKNNEMEMQTNLLHSTVSCSICLNTRDIRSKLNVECGYINFRH